MSRHPKAGGKYGYLGPATSYSSKCLESWLPMCNNEVSQLISKWLKNFLVQLALSLAALPSFLVLAQLAMALVMGVHQPYYWPKPEPALSASI